MVAVNMPAVCRNCDRPFPSGFVADNVQRMTLIGNTSRPCPYCGGLGDVPDGVYDVMDGTIQLVRELPTTREELLIAARILQRHVDEGNADVEAIDREIAEAAPNARPLVQLLRDPATASVLAAIGVIVAVLALALQG